MAVQPQTQPSSRSGMLRILGLAFGIAVSLGGSIGSGIMRTPSQIAARLPSASLIMLAWLLGMAYALLGAWSLAEVGAMIPSSGAYYAIARRAYGDYLGFVVGWSDWLSNCSAVAAAAILIGEYSRDLSPRTAHPTVTASAIMLMIALLQWRGVRWGSRFQNVTSAATALVFFMLVLGAFVAPNRGTPLPSATPLPSGVPLVFAFVLTLQAVIYTYDGWYTSIYFGDELTNPGREMPRAMFHGVFLLSAIYLATNAALLHVLGTGGIARNNLPVAALGAAILGHAGELAVKALMILALVALVNSVVLAATRVLFAMSCDGWGTSALMRVNAGGTPSVALLGSVATTMAFLLTGSFNRVIAITAFIFVAKYGMSYLAVFVLRQREPDTPRPYRSWGYPWTTGLAVAASVAFLVGAFASDLRNSLYGVALLVVSYPIYRLMKKSAQQA